MLIEQLKKANIEALKNKDVCARSILSVVLNKVKLAEIERRTAEKVLEDADIVAILLKTQKELEEEKQGYVKVGNQERVTWIEGQLSYITTFLPKMMSEEEIERIITALPDKSIPFVMRHFKSEYAGTCDMRQVQAVLKRLS